MSGARPRRGVARGDALLLLSVVTLAFCVGYPRSMRTTHRHQLDRAASQVQAVRHAALRFHDERDRWPGPAGMGAIPAELTEYLPAGLAFDRERYQLDFVVWETPEQAPPDTAPPPPGAVFGSIVGVTVRSDEPALLAGLLDRFGPERSFLHAGAWTLVLASVPGR